MNKLYDYRYILNPHNSTARLILQTRHKKSFSSYVCKIQNTLGFINICYLQHIGVLIKTKLKYEIISTLYV